MVQTNADERHIAPHDTFYMLAYVAVKTGTGVEGFDPGQEVHLVEVNRMDHTLVVSDGHAQVEVSPSQLTNDIDMATAARQKDQVSQARVATFTRQQREAYDKFQKDAAESTQKDLDQHNKDVEENLAARAKQENAPVAATAPSANVPLSGPGYYGDGGYGYGNPYSYFVVGSGGSSAANTKAPAAAARAAVPNNVAAPAAGGRAGGGRAK